MPYLQELIHKLEVGPWFRYIKFSLPCLALVLLVVGYNWRSFRNMGTQEAMDAAQVARNVSEGKGYTTLNIRPLSIYLVKTRREAKLGVVAAGQQGDSAQLKRMHPDLANPPVYPCVLAGWMKVYRLLPFADSPDSRFWRKDDRFWWHPDDFLIGLFNQTLFFAVVVLTFFLTRRLFDPSVAWLSAVLLFGWCFLGGCFFPEGLGLPRWLFVLFSRLLFFCKILGCVKYFLFS